MNLIHSAVGEGNFAFAEQLLNEALKRFPEGHLLEVIFDRFFLSLEALDLIEKILGRQGPELALSSLVSLGKKACGQDLVGLADAFLSRVKAARPGALKEWVKEAAMNGNEETLDWVLRMGEDVLEGEDLVAPFSFQNPSRSLSKKDRSEIVFKLINHRLFSANQVDRLFDQAVSLGAVRTIAMMVSQEGRVSLEAKERARRDATAIHDLEVLDALGL